MRKIDFFEIMQYLTRQPVGRELAWDYYRTNFKQLQEDYGDDDPRLGVLLLYITESFETEFLLYELLDFEFDTNSSASANAQLKALEIVATNINWLLDKEEEIAEAFSFERNGSPKKRQGSSPNLNPLLYPINRYSQSSQEFMRRARKAVYQAFDRVQSKSVAAHLKSKNL